ncbi:MULTISPECIES: pyridoxamine 5'-phosphate oxidase family protein [unclassified Sedimentibacter]|uniref:pyridoxamine 5'-phosphate oxidase family protein n=1 Tax=unclassified Sedimentibacter TaxID=2649220 RepID=UPI0027E014B2|nr:pyridoxamine 5'-phosphate oxidase family protein [Sedimentibacter sp. MB35-C1]WMJ76778.1 pyridoxamine 5'-phosphate oxidase family protein [Sedimentibacter sp. MB35-C1]
MNQMRRKDREMKKEFALGIIDKSEYATLATVNEDGTPYCIPVSAARKGDTIYIHCAKTGTKVINIKHNSKVCMSFVGDVHVPVEFNDKSSVEDSDKLIKTRFTTEFESAVVFGTACEINDKDEKMLGLRLISEKYTPLDMPYFEAYVSKSIDITNVIRIDIDTITGKRKKFDKNGIEMKFGRVE